MSKQENESEIKPPSTLQKFFWNVGGLPPESLEESLEVQGKLQAIKDGVITDEGKIENIQAEARQVEERLRELQEGIVEYII